MKDSYKEWKINFERWIENSAELKEFPQIYDRDYEMLENKAWYEANTGLELVRFYQRIFPKDRLPLRLNQFYSIAFKNVFQDENEMGKVKISPIHVDAARQITKTMVKLVFASKPIISLNDENGNEAKEQEDILSNMLEENSFETFIQDAAEKASYSGALGIKFVIDREESEYPIMIAYAKEDIEVFKKYGNRIQAIAFKDYYKVDRKRYCLYSIYGKGFIDYKLYLLGRDGLSFKKEVPLDTIEETKDLTRIEFKNPDGSPCKEIMGIYMENRNEAKSDYAGCIDEFMSLDEIRSNLILFLRTAKIKQYFHDNTLVETEDGSLRIPDSYDTDNIVIKDNNPNWTENEIKRDIVDINNSVQGFKSAFEDVLLQLLTACGLSPSSLGYDVSGANSSGLALEIRERTSLDTRSEKCRRWEGALKEMTRLLFRFNDMEIRGETYVIPEETDWDISIKFADYRRSEAEIVADLVTRLEAGLIDLDSAYEKLYPDLSDDERNLMIENAQGLLHEKEPEIREDDYDKYDDNDDDDKDDLFEENYINEELNPKLWNGNKLQEDVKTKIEQIVNKFKESLEQDGIKFNIEDILIVGSNASYNYNSDSDLDVHIITDMSKEDCDKHHNAILYDLYKSVFNKEYDITINDVEVELYVEDKETTVKSNGIYSLSKGWIKQPVKENVKKVNVDAEVQEWTEKAEKAKSSGNSEEVDSFIDELYKMRKESIASEGEYGKGNLIFKALRRNKTIEHLMEYKRELENQKLSL